MSIIRGEIDMFEIERKFILSGNQHDKLLVALTDSLGRPVRHLQSDKVFLEPGKSFGNHKSGEPLMRLREEDGRSIFTYKRTILDSNNRLEHETGITDPKAIEAILTEINWNLAIVFDKIRYEFRSRSFTYVLDTLEDLNQQFLEIEYVLPADDLDAERKIFAEARSLGINPEMQIERKNYATLIWEARKNDKSNET